MKISKSRAPAQTKQKLQLSKIDRNSQHSTPNIHNHCNIQQLHKNPRQQPTIATFNNHTRTRDNQRPQPLQQSATTEEPTTTANVHNHCNLQQPQPHKTHDNNQRPQQLQHSTSTTIATFNNHTRTHDNSQRPQPLQPSTTTTTQHPRQQPTSTTTATFNAHNHCNIQQPQPHKTHDNNQRPQPLQYSTATQEPTTTANVHNHCNNSTATQEPTTTANVHNHCNSQQPQPHKTHDNSQTAKVNNHNRTPRQRPTTVSKHRPHTCELSGPTSGVFSMCNVRVQKYQMNSPLIPSNSKKDTH